MSVRSDLEKILKRKTQTNFCLVLDIDESLVSTQDVPITSTKILTDSNFFDLRRRIYRSISEEISSKGNYVKTEFWGFTRPYVNEFLLFCFQYFKMVTVWSAGGHDYVHEIVNHLFKDIEMPHIIFTRDDCVPNSKGFLSKPLEKMYNFNPLIRKHMNEKNTIILDDNPIAFEKNPTNALNIPSFGERKGKVDLEKFRKMDENLLITKFWFKQPEIINCGNSPEGDIRDWDKEIYENDLEVLLHNLQIKNSISQINQ